MILIATSKWICMRARNKVNPAAWSRRSMYEPPKHNEKDFQ